MTLQFSFGVVNNNDEKEVFYGQYELTSVKNTQNFQVMTKVEAPI